MNKKFTAETEFNSLIWTREEYEQSLQEEKEFLEKVYRKAKNKTLIIRCSAWFFLIMTYISAIVFDNAFIACINWAMTFMLLIILKFGKYF